MEAEDLARCIVDTINQFGDNKTEAITAIETICAKEIKTDFEKNKEMAVYLIEENTTCGLYTTPSKKEVLEWLRGLKEPAETKPIWHDVKEPATKGGLILLEFENGGVCSIYIMEHEPKTIPMYKEEFSSKIIRWAYLEEIRNL